MTVLKAPFKICVQECFIRILYSLISKQLASESLDELKSESPLMAHEANSRGVYHVVQSDQE